MHRRHLLALGSLPWLTSCESPKTQAPAPVVTAPATAASTTPPPPRPPAAPAREWRAAWVATVANIDWPSKAGLSPEQQQAEIRSLCDTAARIGLNALLLQVRTSCDAFYESNLEPWSEYLTGTQGQHPGYDPLAVWLREARARGLELHAWINPYRARQSRARGPAAASHLSRRRPEWVKTYGDQLWVDPGEPAAAEHLLAVVRDLLGRYAVDGLHLDDYFYPYPTTAAAASSAFAGCHDYSYDRGGLPTTYGSPASRKSARFRLLTIAVTCLRILSQASSDAATLGKSSTTSARR